MQQAKDRPFGYTVTGEDPVVVTIRGELDVATAPELAALLDDLARSNRELALDLGAVEFMDSTCLTVLVKTVASLRDVGGHLQICSASKRVRRIFDLTGLEELLPLSARLEGSGS